MDEAVSSAQHKLLRELEGNLARFGDTPQGMGWPNPEKAETSYEVMLGLVPPGERATLLDVGCGAAHLYAHLLKSGRAGGIQYSGVELSPAYRETALRKFPSLTVYLEDIMSPECGVPVHDYVVMNSLFSYKGSVPFETMWQYCQGMLLAASRRSRRGFAINMMSKLVDWERDDLFHLPFDLLGSFLSREISRRFTLRHDYGMFEYTVYVYPDHKTAA